VDVDRDGSAKDEGMTDRDPAPVDGAVVEALIAALADGRAHPFDELFDSLRHLLRDDDEKAALELDDAIDAIDRLTGWDDDQIVDLHALLDGRCFTHRVSPAEAAAEVIAVAPDVDVAVLAFSEEVPLVDGRSAAIVFAGDLDGDADADLAGAMWGGGLRGPEGWLDGAKAGGLVGVWSRDGRIELLPADADGSLTDVAARQLTDGFADLVDTDDGATQLVDLVLRWLAAHPDALCTPHEPLAVLLERAGLEWRGDYVGRIGSGWLTPFERARMTERALTERVYGFDRCCHDALDAVRSAFALGPEGGQPLAAVAAALSHGRVAEAFAARRLGGADDLDAEGEAVVAFAEAVADAARGKDAAGPLYVRAIGLECLGEAVEAEESARAAVRSDPAHRGAAEALAGYLDVRGEAARALEYLRRAGVDESDTMVRRLADVVAMSRPAAGRNDPCPCGSGRKYKACCIDRPSLPLELAFQWLYEKAIEFAMHPARRGEVIHLAAHAVESSGLDDSPERRALTERRFAELALFDRGLLEQFIDEREDLLPAQEAEALEAWQDVRLAVYEVVDAPDRAEPLTLRDTRTGETAQVTAAALAAMVAPGDLITGRLLPFGDGLFVGGPIMRVDLAVRESALDLAGDADADACDWAEWIGHAERPPRMVNAEHEDLVIATARYRTGDPDAALAALAAELDAGSHDRELVQHVEVDGQRYVRGTVRIEDHHIVIEANSLRRRERLAELVESVVPDAVFVDEAETAMDEMLDRMRAEAPPAPEPVSAETAEALAEYLADYARKWVDTEVLALGGLTPRQALDDPTRREDLIALLGDFERQEAAAGPGPGAGMPTAVVRRELGLD
jgi:tetratricopeptide (TPR) repeat protein